jgi:hypothetical protein
MSSSADLVLFLAILGGVATAIVHIVFAVGVFADATRMDRERGQGTRIVPGPMWAFATLLGGVLVAAAYWLIHHSSLSERD